MKRSQSRFTNVLLVLSLVAAFVAVLAAPLPAQAADATVIIDLGAGTFIESQSYASWVTLGDVPVARF